MQNKSKVINNAAAAAAPAAVSGRALPSYSPMQSSSRSSPKIAACILVRKNRQQPTTHKVCRSILCVR